MNRTLKLTVAGVVATLGLAVIGVSLWDWQKSLHPYLWNLYPIDSRTAEIKCVGIAFLGLYVWEADNWRCYQHASLEETNQFSGVLDDPNCELNDEYIVRCSEPNKILASVSEVRSH